jgi:hypothetical protein
MLNLQQRLSLLRGSIYAPDFRDKQQQNKWYATVTAHKHSILVCYGNAELFKEAAYIWLQADNMKFANQDDIKQFKINVFKLTLVL